ncbi:hypothetical protein HII17_17735 [Thalassotalea sp. M1531]|uniref:Uncharacterized protein n=1 Tax=Thalassotalea algicola TaxID=2716224 RepID=A0A7Y0Q8X9_9GAMM|nr:hypothetical protein [Thalassotalea algicola]NMP33392.1 hypothetical protein [Thalassotalea algicola]
MKKFAYLILLLSTVIIFIPSVLEITSGMVTESIKPNKIKNTFKIVVVHKEKSHKASEKQWQTISSAANYFVDDKIGSKKFNLQNNEFQFVEYYEDIHQDIICENKGGAEFDNVIAIFGPITSGCAMSMLDNKLTIPTITSFATGPVLNPKGESFFYRSVPNDTYRVAELLKTWRPDIDNSVGEHSLIIYKSDNQYSLPSAELVKNYIDNKHQIDYIDVAELQPFDKYKRNIKYNTIFVLINPTTVEDLIRTVKHAQISDHNISPKFVVKAEAADTKLFNHRGSLVALTPTLELYNSPIKSSFLSIGKDKLHERSASSFLAFEAIYKAIEYATNNTPNACANETSEVNKWRCTINTRLKEPFRSELIGNEIEFDKDNGDIKTHFLHKAEIRKLGTNFSLSTIDKELPPLVNIKLQGNRNTMWLGAPQKILFDTQSEEEIVVKFNYTPPDWIPNGEIRRGLTSLLSTSKKITNISLPYEFHPLFIGKYNVNISGLGDDLRQSSGKHEIVVSPPLYLFVAILVALFVALIIAGTDREHQEVVSKKKILIDVFLSSLFLYIMTVTLRGYSLPLAPTLSFSDDPLTNALYCGIVAGSIRMKIFNYLITPIVKRFNHEPQTPKVQTTTDEKQYI